MSTSTFVIAKLAENAMGTILSRDIGLEGSMGDGDDENLGRRSCYVWGGCLNESLIEGMLSPWRMVTFLSEEWT